MPRVGLWFRFLSLWVCAHLLELEVSGLDVSSVCRRDVVAVPVEHADYCRVMFCKLAATRPTSRMPNITLVTHATIDRLPHIQRWCQTLRGPMSISIFVRPVIDDPQHTMERFADDPCIHEHGDLHLVFTPNHRYDPSPRAEGRQDMMTHYPFNVQRNAALDGAIGDLVLLMDADFHLFPIYENDSSDGFSTGEERLRHHFFEQQELYKLRIAASGHHWSWSPSIVINSAVYVIPAVETLNRKISLPTTFSELRSAVAEHQVFSFYYDCRQCHIPTDLRRFLRSKEPYRVEYLEGYEPYVIMNRSSTTPLWDKVSKSAASSVKCLHYDEAFVGRGWDKMSFFYETAAQQRIFVVLAGQFFLAHFGRGDQPSFLSDEYKDRQEVNRELWGNFHERMLARYDIEPPTDDGEAERNEADGAVNAEQCSEHNGPSGKFCAVPFFRVPTVVHSKGMPNITFVTHATIDRLPHVMRWCRTFGGPMSLSIFVRPFVDDARNVTLAFASDECLRRHATIHVLREANHTFNTSIPPKDMTIHYPFNIQRNLALDGAVGDLVWLMDADFHVAPHNSENDGPLEFALREQVRLAKEYMSSTTPDNSDCGSDGESTCSGNSDLQPHGNAFESAVFVVPTVETVAKGLPLPKNMEELQRAVEEDVVCPFYGHHCRVCHRPTNLKRFLKSSQPYVVEYLEGYEPYAVLNKSSLSYQDEGKSHSFPRYREEFVGRWKDKMSFYLEIAAQRRKFVVLPKYFLIHEGRGDVPELETQHHQVRMRENLELYGTLKKELKAKYQF